MLRSARFAGIALLAAGLFAAGAAQADDPGLHEIYQGASTGKLDQAQTMMTQVLHDHPRSGKAHYVEAELLARQGHLASASAELANAQRMAPGLPFAKSQSVRDLKARIASGSAQRPSIDSTMLPAIGMGAASMGSSRLPWSFVIVGLGLIALTLLAFRSLARRATPSPASTGVANYGTATTMPGFGSTPMAPAGSGIGSYILGGLATGAAVGAGMVAGEAIMHHFTDPSVGSLRAETPLPVVPDNGSFDMGGQDFGIADGGSWDDATDLGAGGFDGGALGDDWS